MSGLSTTQVAKKKATQNFFVCPEVLSPYMVSASSHGDFDHVDPRFTQTAARWARLISEFNSAKVSTGEPRKQKKRPDTIW